MNKIHILSVSLLAVLTISCAKNTKQRTGPPPYSSTQELKEPVIFGQNEINTQNGISFSKSGNTLYTSAQLSKKFDDGRVFTGIFVSHYRAGEWTKPEQLQLALDIDAYHPVLSNDNKVLFFNSRSDPDMPNTSIPHNIWAMRKTPNGWGQPEMVDGINSLAHDSYPSIAKNNNIYFNSDREGGKGGMDFYVSYFTEGKYQKPLNLESLNSSEAENDLVVDPDERFVIFNRYIKTTNEIDLHISFRKGNEWTVPRKLDNLNLADAWELTPTLSPDGKYLFYELKHNIMQIDLASLIYAEELVGIGNR